MKPKNFPARKLRRQIRARRRQLFREHGYLTNLLEEQRQIDEARQIKTKKYRGPKK